MRLIDADALAEEIKENMENGFPANEYLSLYAISCIAHAPTVDVLDKIRAEIAEYGSIWVAYAITDKTKTDKGIERLVSDVLSQAKKQVLDIIDKYKGE